MPPGVLGGGAPAGGGRAAAEAELLPGSPFQLLAGAPGAGARGGPAEGSPLPLPRSPFQLLSEGPGMGGPAAAVGARSTPLRTPFMGAVQGVAGPDPGGFNPNPGRLSALRRLASRAMSYEYSCASPQGVGVAAPCAGQRQVTSPDPRPGSGGLAGSLGSGVCDMETLSSTVRQLSMRGSSCDLDRAACA